MGKRMVKTRHCWMGDDCPEGRIVRLKAGGPPMAVVGHYLVGPNDGGDENKAHYYVCEYMAPDGVVTTHEYLEHLLEAW